MDIRIKGDTDGIETAEMRERPRASAHEMPQKRNPWTESEPPPGTGETPIQMGGASFW